MTTGQVVINQEMYEFDSSGHLIMGGETILVPVEVYTDSTFRSEFNGAVDAYDLLELANIPYEKTWNIIFDVTKHNSTGMEMDNCTSAPSAPCTCVGNNLCTNATSSAYHHKNASKNLALLANKYPNKRGLNVGLSGSRVMCYNSGSNNHGNVYGLSYLKDWYSYCAADNTDITRSVRVIQHEMSHLYGTTDDPCPEPCTMHGGFDLLPLHVEDIWCSRCKGMFERGFHQGL